MAHMSQLDFVVIDPFSSEPVRGSFCFKPYLLFSYLTGIGLRGAILEGYVDGAIPKAEKYYIGCWSYPQIEACIELNERLEGALFVGYKPILDYAGLSPIQNVCDATSMVKFGEHIARGTFEKILEYDCDMHMKEFGDDVAHPFFTSYGCNRGCSFCPAYVCSGGLRMVMSVDETIRIIEVMSKRGIRAVHFTDEDLFFNIDRAYELLTRLEKNDMIFLCLSSGKKLIDFVERYGTDIIDDAGLKVIEVGLETADPEQQKLMNKMQVNTCEKLGEIFLKTTAKIFWLTMTFFPGETIKSINRSGEFLRLYGHDLELVNDRIASNSTVGGLGQFFQLYHGTKKYSEYVGQGLEITKRPIRLSPSYIPYSFSNSKFRFVGIVDDEYKRYFSLYGLTQDVPLEIIAGGIVGDIVDDDISILIKIAILARLGIVEEV